MNILIADTAAPSLIDGLHTLDADVTYAPELTPEALQHAISGVDILIVRSTRVTERTINAAQDLSLIVRAGAGVNTIDVNAATNKGIYVANCPGKNANAVAELVIGLIIALDRGIVEAANDLRSGIWKKQQYSPGRGLSGSTLGILGFGATGRAVAAAARGLGMEIVAWSRSLTPKNAAQSGVGFCASAADVAKCAEVISIHMAAVPSSYHLVNRRFLQRMRDGAYLINTSRGEIVDRVALKEAIQGKGLRVALDVFANEPAEDGPHFIDPELLKLVIPTPHIAASTEEAMEAISRELVRIVSTFISSGIPPHAVNAPRSKSFDDQEYSFDYAY